MANALANFVVGLGYKYDRRGESEIVSGLGSIKSQVLQLGSIVAGGYGVKQLTVDFAESRAALGEFASVFGVLPEDIAAIGQALEREGGSMDGFIGQLESVERLRAGLLRGDAGFIGQAGRAGLDVQPLIDAQNATEAYIALADQFAALSQDQRINAAEAIGLDEASIRLLSVGGEQLRQIIADQKAVRTVTTEMTEVGKEFRNELGELGDYAGGFADQISVTLLPSVTELVSEMNDWLSVNRELIDSGISEYLEPVGEHIGAIAAAGVLLASGGLLKGLSVMSRTIPLIGAGMATAASSAARLNTLAIGGVVANELWDWGPEDVEELTGFKPPEWLFTPIGDLFGSDTPEAATTGSAPGAARIMTGDDAGDLVRSLGGVGSVNRPSSVAVTLELDGQVLDKRIVQTVGREADNAIDDISSGVRD